jgi:hypothetical protein
MLGLASCSRVVVVCFNMAVEAERSNRPGLLPPCLERAFDVVHVKGSVAPAIDAYCAPPISFCQRGAIRADKNQRSLPLLSI